MQCPVFFLEKKLVDTNLKLTVLHDANGSFSNHSNDALDFSRDSFALTLTQTTSYLYIGYRKPINTIYFQLDTPNTNANTLSMQYWNGSSWTTLSNAQDDTKGLTRSGFITWDRNQTNEATTTVNSTTLYWVRFQPSVTTSAMTVAGISFIFADDQDLKQEVPEITDSNHLAGKTSHILTHVATRNQIIQDLRNKDYTRTNQNTSLKEDLTVWDILDANQLKQAAIFLSLSKIYFNFSDQPNDKYEQKSLAYFNKYEKAIALSRLSLDTDDDGLSDSFETQKLFTTSRMVR